MLVFQTAGAQSEFFQGRGGFVKLGFFHKHFVKKSRTKGHAGVDFGLFSFRYS